MRCGLIGEKLGHSHSKTLHGLLADYRYDLIELAPGELGDFLQKGEFDGLNVTIPYKQAVIPYLRELTPAARAIGSVNTIVRRPDGTLLGDNTDAYGLGVIAARAGMAFAGEKTLILGSGGTAKTARHVVEAAGGEAVTVSRTGETNYENLERHADAAWLINATPVGMYPGVQAAPVDLARLPGLRGVAEVIYNPLRTRLMQQARALGIPCEGGLAMLVYQAVRACERFTGRPVPPERAAQAERALRRAVTGLALVGMPGAGKSTVGALAAAHLGMPFVDLDREIEKAAGMPIPRIFEAEGEAGFRRRETEALRRFALAGGQVIAAGGGIVKRAENRELLRMNCVVVHIRRALEKLPTEGRPLSAGGVGRLWRERAGLYAAAADAEIENGATAEACVREVEEAYHEAVCD